MQSGAGVGPRTKELAKYLDLSYAYARTLKPKATKKKC
jgi:hypothetical protein